LIALKQLARGLEVAERAFLWHKRTDRERDGAIAKKSAK
jgi:hypothetical protein